MQMDVVKHLSQEGKSVKRMKILGYNTSRMVRGSPRSQKPNSNRCWSILYVVCACLLSFALADALGAEGEIVTMGEVKVDVRARSLSFPAEVNQRSGAIEYLVVHETGKVHESIFRTSVAPKQIHVAALLLSTKDTNSVAPKPLFTEPTIRVSWKENGKEKVVAAEELILDRKKKRALGKTKWAYRGSKLIDGVFLADREGSVIAVMEDRNALIDQATPDAADDENWEPMTEVMPELKTKVTIQIVFGK
jgi:hypothetical protein